MCPVGKSGEMINYGNIFGHNDKSHNVTYVCHVDETTSNAFQFKKKIHIHYIYCKEFSSLFQMDPNCNLPHIPDCDSVSNIVFCLVDFVNKQNESDISIWMGEIRSTNKEMIGINYKPIYMINICCTIDLRTWTRWMTHSQKVEKPNLLSRHTKYHNLAICIEDRNERVVKHVISYWSLSRPEAFGAFYLKQSRKNSTN